MTLQLLSQNRPPRIASVIPLEGHTLILEISGTQTVRINQGTEEESGQETQHVLPDLQ